MRGGFLRAGLALAVSISPAAAQFDVYDNPSVLSLPTTLRATVRVPLASAPSGPADTLAALYPRLAACWRPPADLGAAAITARFALRRDGSLQGQPRITFARVPPERRAALTAETLSSLIRCTPARLKAGLGGAVAGRPIALRFVYSGPNQGDRP
ncbi:hypothetical protein [Methylobacterium nonmethylotrophicum]|uniref:TonB C-terminal domain-containing protein n=1 Tax=Methylobacterium nonmethylotrophicum TaxID=1141884 RepID=A0A4Z0NR97_9HYPH|nr:hypothetical protein [Methylobacterium nonmethylotrophicum]TGD99331.1 hypothetical protein EU555_12495 [Methylobacterium nonmethylotrophicum]